MPYRGSMRIVNHRLLAGCATALVATFALAGCVSAPTPTPSTSAATDAPVFASDEEALAAATEAYSAYLAAIDTVLAQGGGDTSKLADVASGEALVAETKTAEMYAERGYRSLGSTIFDSLKLQAIDGDGDGRTLVSTYLCSDVSAVDVLDLTGASIVPSDRVDRFPLQITFKNSEVNSTRLLISSSETWTGSNFC